VLVASWRHDGFGLHPLAFAVELRIWLGHTLEDKRVLGRASVDRGRADARAIGSQEFQRERLALDHHLRRTNESLRSHRARNLAGAVVDDRLWLRPGSKAAFACLLYRQALRG